MRSSSIILLATTILAPFVAATELKIDNKDVPFACTQACSQLQQLTETCYKNRDKNNKDKSEAQCVCPTNNKSFDVASSAMACQQCFTQQRASNDQRENIDRIVRVCGFQNKQPPSPATPQMPTAILPPLAATCKPVTMTVTVTANCSSPFRPTGNIPRPPTVTPTAVRPTTRPPVPTIRPTGSRPGNATRPGKPLPTAAASTLSPGFQLAAVAAFVYMLA